jgi:hypothetical protein
MKLLTMNLSLSLILSIALTFPGIAAAANETNKNAALNSKLELLTHGQFRLATDLRFHNPVASVLALVEHACANTIKRSPKDTLAATRLYIHFTDWLLSNGMLAARHWVLENHERTMDGVDWMDVAIRDGLYKD